MQGIPKTNEEMILASAISGEDFESNRMVTRQCNQAAYITGSVSEQTVSASPCTLVGLIVGTSVGGKTITLKNGAGGTTRMVFQTPASATNGFFVDCYSQFFDSGLYVTLSDAGLHVTVVYFEGADV